MYNQKLNGDQSDTPKIRLSPSKSLLSSINLGYDTTEEPTKPEHDIIFTEGESLLTTISTGFEHKDKPALDSPNISLVQDSPKDKNPNSIITDIDTGFGNDNTLHVECPKPQYKSLLYKENYLGEFETEEDKQQVRQNLEIYSKSETTQLIAKVVSGNNEVLATKEELNQAIADLDFVDSTLKANSNYDIPNNLFKL